MDKVLVADVFIPGEKPVTNQPLFFVQRKAAINLFKTVLFLVSLSLLIINQVKKDKLSARIPGKAVQEIAIDYDNASMFPFGFTK